MGGTGMTTRETTQQWKRMSSHFQWYIAQCTQWGKCNNPLIHLPQPPPLVNRLTPVMSVIVTQQLVSSRILDILQTGLTHMAQYTDESVLI